VDFLAEAVVDFPVVVPFRTSVVETEVAKAIKVTEAVKVIAVAITVAVVDNGRFPSAEMA
jgi:hypothetical protein